MNKLIIVGNGFDLAHGLKTSYKDFIEWYLEKIINSIKESIGSKKSNEINNELLRIKINPNKYDNDYVKHEILTEINTREISSPMTFLYHLQWKRLVALDLSSLLIRITKSLETKNWVDIEYDYFTLLKDNHKNIEICKGLNRQMLLLKQELAQYLISLQNVMPIDGMKETIMKPIEDIVDISPDYCKQNIVRFPVDTLHIMVLNFNYTHTINLYLSEYGIMSEKVSGIEEYQQTIENNNIHGDLSNVESMIFGYGDELDTEFKQLVEVNENELLKNVKSIKYLETNQYRRLKEFIAMDEFEVYIMGHSCGTSDRTLLNTIFKHNNCKVIRPFYHKRDDGSDNYLDIVLNIYRVFDNSELFREKVMEKPECVSMPQCKLT